MILFDSHCHLQDERIFSKVDEIVEKSIYKGIKYMLCCGSSENDWDIVGKLSERFNAVIPAFGIHPWYISEKSEKWVNKLETYLQKYPASAVGEIGLDHAISDFDKEEQRKVFYTQLKIANLYKRAVSIHCRKAWGEIIEIFRKEPELAKRCVIHSYSGTPALVEELVSYGVSISFSCSITKKNNKRAPKSALKVPLDFLLVETDSPDIPPEGYDGNNEPSNLLLVVHKLSEILQIEEEKVAEITYKNAVSLFVPSAFL
ncbi:MAG: TatD family hydrolase [Chitinispirillaceae bacterium]|nr:TatD family hydrolase [Chitinispirillaceae bacterium]